jgi:hypothetical protein
MAVRLPLTLGSGSPSHRGSRGSSPCATSPVGWLTSTVARHDRRPPGRRVPIPVAILWILGVVDVVGVVVIVAAVVVWLMARLRRRQQLRERFGPECDKAVDGDQTRRVARLHIGALPQRTRHQSRHDQSQVSTEELRTAMVHYRSLFEDLLDATVDGRADQVGNTGRGVNHPGT